MSTPLCKARQYSDQMACSECGLSWDVNDPEPPICGKKTALPGELAESRLLRAGQDEKIEVHTISGAAMEMINSPAAQALLEPARILLPTLPWGSFPEFGVRECMMRLADDRYVTISRKPPAGMLTPIGRQGVCTQERFYTVYGKAGEIEWLLHVGVVDMEAVAYSHQGRADYQRLDHWKKGIPKELRR